MARRAQPLGAAPGIAAAGGLVGLIAAAMGAVVWRADTGLSIGPADLAALRFTLVQAVASAVLSVALAIPVARALARRSFPGRRALVLLLGAPFILPAIVAVLGLVAVFGRGGWINSALVALGLEPVSIYGLHGVVLAHVFFNMPLAVRLILQGWQDIPAERFRLAAQIGAEARDIWRLLERPMLMRIVPGILAVVFAICLTSFAVALTLGGGPAATTLELAIYQAFRFDFDLGRAAALSILQVALAGAAAVVALALSGTAGFGAGLDRPVERWEAEKRRVRFFDITAIGLAGVFLLAPLSAVVLRGIDGLPDLPFSVVSAAGTSLMVAAVSTCLTLAMALPMAAALAVGRTRMVDVAGLLGLAASPLAIGTGLFILTYSFVDPARLSLPVTAVVNAVMALPFCLRSLVPATRDILDTQGRLASALDIVGWRFYRLVLLPRLRPQIGFAAGLSAALSMGDLGVIALFADPDRATLPLQIYRLMGAYRMEAASGAALLLLVLSLACFWICDRGGRLHARS